LPLLIEEGWTRTGRPEDVSEELRRSIAAMVRAEDVDEFYVGRTNGVEARVPKHGADVARCVYETDGIDSSQEVEDDLIKFFYDHAKCNNRAEHASSARARSGRLDHTTR
jgi:hypothetical protein